MPIELITKGLHSFFQALTRACKKPTTQDINIIRPGIIIKLIHQNPSAQCVCPLPSDLALFFNSSKYLCARPSIQIVKENLKFGYAMATFLLKTPSMASCAQEPSCIVNEDISICRLRLTLTGNCRDMTSLTARSIGSGWGYLAYINAMVAHAVWTTCVSACSTHWAISHVYAVAEHPNQEGCTMVPHLVALSPTTVSTLLANEILACPTRSLACLVSLAH